MATINNVNLKQRSDTLANWTSQNPVLLKGQIGFITNAGTGATESMVIGDGSSTFTSLTPFNLQGLVASAIVSSLDTYFGDTDWRAQLTDEQVQDKVGAMFTGNTEAGISTTYNDSTGKIDITVTGGGLTQEEIEDFLGTSFLVNGTGISISYNDAGNSLTISLADEQFTTALLNKLNAIEDGAEVNLSGAETVTLLDTYFGDSSWRTGGGDISGATNLGASGEGLFAQKSGPNLEFKKIVAGTNVTVTSTATGVVINSTGGTGAGLTQEEVEDIIGARLIGGTGITKTYDDVSGETTIELTNEEFTTALLNKLNGIEDGAQVNPTNEETQDAVAPMLAHGNHTNITATYDDPNNEIRLSASSGDGLLPKYYDAFAVNFFIDPSFVGTSDGSITNPYTTTAEAEAYLATKAADEYVHIYIRSGQEVEAINIGSVPGVSRLQRNKIATYGAAEGYKAVIGFKKTTETWTNVTGNIWETTTTGEVVFDLDSDQQYLTSSEVTTHAITDVSASPTIKVPSLAGDARDLVGAMVDFQPFPYVVRRARITAYNDNGVDTTITLSEAEGGTISWLDGLSRSIRIHGCHENLSANNQYAVNEAGKIRIYSDTDPNNKNLIVSGASTLQIGVNANSDIKFWELDNLEIKHGGIHGLHVRGDHTGHRHTNLFIHDVHQVPYAVEGSNVPLENKGLFMKNIICWRYGGSGVERARCYNSYTENVVCIWGDHSDGQFYGNQHRVHSFANSGDGFFCSNFRDIDAGEPLDDARGQNTLKNIFVFGSAKNGMTLSGYGNKVDNFYALDYSQFCSDTSGMYFGSRFTHGSRVRDCFVDGRGERALMNELTDGPGDVHGYYIDNYAFDISVIGCVAVNHQLNEANGIRQNLGSHGCKFMYNLLSNNAVGFRRKEFSGGTVAPSERTVFRYNRVVCMGQQIAWEWDSNVTGSDPYVDYDPGVWRDNEYIYIGDGAMFRAKLNNINASRAFEGITLEAAILATANYGGNGQFEEGSTVTSRANLYPASNWVETAEIVHASVDPTFASNPGTPYVNVFGNAAYDAVNDRFSLSPASAVNIGDIDNSNIMWFNDDYFNLYNPTTSDLVIFAFKVSAEQDGMMFQLQISTGGGAESDEPRVVCDTQSKWVLVAVRPSENYSAGWLCAVHPIRTDDSADYNIYIESLYGYYGTGDDIDIPADLSPLLDEIKDIPDTQFPIIREVDTAIAGTLQDYETGEDVVVYYDKPIQ